MSRFDNVVLGFEFAINGLFCAILQGVSLPLPSGWKGCLYKGFMKLNADVPKFRL